MRRATPRPRRFPSHVARGHIPPRRDAHRRAIPRCAKPRDPPPAPCSRADARPAAAGPPRSPAATTHTGWRKAVPARPGSRLPRRRLARSKWLPVYPIKWCFTGATLAPRYGGGVQRDVSELLDARFLGFLAIAVLVIITPGPDTVLTIRNTLVGGP